MHLLVKPNRNNINKTCVLFSLKFLSETALIQRRIQWHIIINARTNRYSRQISMKLEFSRQIFERYSNTKFRRNLSSGNRVVPCGRKNGQADRYDRYAKALRKVRRRKIYSCLTMNSNWKVLTPVPEGILPETFRGATQFVLLSSYIAGPQFPSWPSSIINSCLASRRLSIGVISNAQTICQAH